MAHFAEVNEDNLVLRVLVTDNNDPNGDEGYSWLVSNFGGCWIKTSYNNKIRKNFAGVGFTFSNELDAFIPPKPYDSWTLDLETCQWVSPIPYPNTDIPHYWDEASGSWIAFA